MKTSKILIQTQNVLSTAIMAGFASMAAILPAYSQSEEVTEHYVESTPDHVGCNQK